MGFLYSPLPLWVAIAGWAVALCALAIAVRGRPFVKLSTDALQHLWLSTVVTLAVLWAFDIWVQDGAVLHLLGATLMVTLFGWALALVGSCVVVALVALILGSPWQGIGLTMLALGVLPVLISAGVQHVLAARLPSKRAAFVLGHGAATSILAVLVAMGAVVLGHALVGDVSWPSVSGAFLSATAVLMVGECLFTGVMTALIAVYKPAWMKTFDQRLNRVDR
ncbi:energy-coupling factor ABC transporter permease [Robbsia sp. Bb-Pol-6]|uniref:Energy-coupling factor ABC transporter permease n=1 Tax=Robbsia betulipollinis TaxID=2981849 RepID=A0ABT3ZN72_9BURK|nr:energy-coupling factor ABC transporter permease [Robbsia betulipollinis]MCY0387767.1 energy-coupling factor ABC transporter permease [Robbsia betulipollinis]